jgi:hypothetical protein
MQSLPRTLLLWLLRVVLALVAAFCFFVAAPLSGSKAVAQLAPNEIPQSGVPSWAKSFHYDHGRVAFSNLSAPATNPLPTMALFAGSIAALAALVMSFAIGEKRK